MGNLDKISGQIVHPPMEDDVGENEEETKVLNYSD